MDIRLVDTSDSQQQFYKTNLLSLFYIRAAQDISVEKFEFVESLDKPFSRFSPLSEIRFKIKIQRQDKPINVFFQACHKTNKKHILRIDVAAYIETYMKWKHIMDNTELLFVLYTNANVDTECNDASTRSELSAKLNSILNTGGKVKCLNNEENIEYLTKKTIEDRITSLAKTIARYILDKHDFQRMMLDELVLRYHVILAQKVFDISDVVQTEIPIIPPQHRIASFRREFLINNEEYMMLFKVTLFFEIIIEKQLKHDEIQLYLSEFIDVPTATRLSKLIGTAVSYNSGQIEFNKQLTEAFRSNMKPMDFLRATDYKAVALAATAVLSSVMFKVPAAFGNKDLTISGSDAEIEKRICYLASTMKELLDKCDESKIVTIDESLGNGFLELDGGVAGAIGNIFVLDENTQLTKITDNWKSLNSLAQRLYKKLTDVIHNMHAYTFCFKVERFPELLIGGYDKKMATDILNKFFVCYNQAEESDVQQILKNEIVDIQRNEPNYFQIKSDAMILRYHNEIRKKWCSEQPESYYFQGNIDLFRKSKNATLSVSLISIISELYFNKIKKYDYTFTEDAVKSLKLPDRPSSTILVTENCVLTAVKVLQHLKEKKEPYIVLDVEYIASLPANDQNALRAELKDANQKDLLVLISDKVDNSHEKTLENIADTVRNKSIIVILNQKTLEISHKYFAKADNMLYDKKFSLIDVNIDSQLSILFDATAVFPGVELRLGVLLRGWPKTDHASRSAAEGGTAAVTDEREATGLSESTRQTRKRTFQEEEVICGIATSGIMDGTSKHPSTGSRHRILETLALEHRIRVRERKHSQLRTRVKQLEMQLLKERELLTKIRDLSAQLGEQRTPSKPERRRPGASQHDRDGPHTERRSVAEHSKRSAAAGGTSADIEADNFLRWLSERKRQRQTLQMTDLSEREKYPGDAKLTAAGGTSADNDMDKLEAEVSRKLKKLKRMTKKSHQTLEQRITFTKE